MKTKQKREYERPQMEVVELRHRTMILAGSGGLGNRGYDPDPDDPNSGD